SFDPSTYGQDDYFATAPGTVLTVKTPGPIVKEVVASSNPETGSAEFDPALTDLTVGETVTYRVTFTLNEGNFPFLTLTDSLPTGPAGVMSLVGARLVSAGRNVNSGSFRTDTDGNFFYFPIDPIFTFVDTDGDTLNDQVAINFTARNLPDNIV